ncbi:MAG: hypothetical protein EOO81_11260 [Oxalobacteraceae bacterium]|nr:MAG: hypothetical protein EOO81_11260 [Oxalobacteraceae bacterium]
MDALEFLSKVTPGKQHSRLTPFLADITLLRQHGCTLEQVCEFLATNNVQISIAGLSKFIKRREEGPAIALSPHPESGAATSRAALATQVEPAHESSARITNPSDVRKASRREINLEDYGNEKE